MSKFIIESMPDLDSHSASNILSLIKTCKSTQCSIALGAGMSASAGLPNWDKYLRKISYAYFEHWIFDINRGQKHCNYINPPQNISIAFTEGYDIHLFEEYEQTNTLEKENQLSVSDQIKSWSGKDFENVDVYTNNNKWSPEKVKTFFRKITETLTLESSLQSDFLDNIMKKNSLLVAQMIKNRIKAKDWDYLLRKALYSSYEYIPYQLNISPLMNSCIKIIKSLDIKNIINYNYDDTMYHALLQNGVKCDNVYCGKVNTSKPSIYYPHGYIPMKGGVKTEIVLTEQEYQKQSSQVGLWSNNIQISVYNNTSCIFLGLSLEDPNLRRILNMCNKTIQRNHFAFLPKSTGDGSVPEMIDALFDSDLLRFGIKVIRYPLIDGSHERLPELLDTTIKAIHGDLKLI